MKIQKMSMARSLTSLLERNTLTQSKDEFEAVYGESAPSFTTVKFLDVEFK